MTNEPDWSSFPPELSYLIEPAEKYGLLWSYSLVEEFQRTASEDEMNELAALAEKVRLNQHLPLVNQWLDVRPLNEYKESNLLYFMFWAMDMMFFEFD